MNLIPTDLKLFALVAGAAWLNVRFGVEWDRVLESGSERKPEANPVDFAPADADAPELERFLNQWAGVKARFAESPEGAVAEADDLVWFLMKTRGYLLSDVNQCVDGLRVSDIPADHRRVVDNYRSACELAARIGKERVTANELRTAMIQYRSVFDELIGRAAGKELKLRDAEVAKLEPANIELLPLK